MHVRAACGNTELQARRGSRSLAIGFSGAILALTLLFGPASVAQAAPQAGPVASWVELQANGVVLTPGPVGGFDTAVPSRIDARGIAVTHDGLHTWVVGADGGVFALASAPVPLVLGQPKTTTPFFGSLPSLGIVPRREIIGIAATPTGHGYWLAGSDGGVFAFGDARFLGSLAAAPRGRIVGIAPTPSGHGYWLVGSDGGIFAFGDARFRGSIPALGIALRAKIVGIAVNRKGDGYWLAGSDGGVFAFGAAPFLGRDLAGGDPAVAIVSAPLGVGYGVVHRSSGVVGFGAMPSGGVCENLARFTPQIVAAATYQTHVRVCNA